MNYLKRELKLAATRHFYYDRVQSKCTLTAKPAKTSIAACGLVINIGVWY